MTNRHYIEDRAWQSVGGDVPVTVTLVDLGDGTHAPSVHDVNANEKLAALATKLDSIQTTLNSVLAKLQASVNVKVVP